MFDRTRSVYSSNLNYPVLAGQTIAAEGVPMVLVTNGTGGTAARPCTAAAEKFIGFSRFDCIKVTTEVVVEMVTVPLTGGNVNLSHGNLVSGSVSAYNTDTATALTLAASPPATGEFSINLTNGIIEFNVAQASDVVQVTYRRNLTVEEIQMKYRVSLPNNIAMDWFHAVDVMGGTGNMYTDQYNTSQAHLFVPMTVVTLGANGLLAVGGAGTAIGYVIQQPGINDQFLGVHYTSTL